MDKIKKLFKKISKKDREKLLLIIRQIINNDENIEIIKIKNTDFYRVRSNKFRIIFHNENNDIIIDSIRIRNENTYKNL